MRYKRPALLLLLVALAVLSTACPATTVTAPDGTTAPAVDLIAVRAEQTYVTARETANLLFVLEDENQALIESKFPGTHKLVEKLRVRVREDLPRLLQAIDTYKAARDAGKSDLLIALALGDAFLAEVQTILGNSQKAVTR